MGVATGCGSAGAGAWVLATAFDRHDSRVGDPQLHTYAGEADVPLDLVGDVELYARAASCRLVARASA